MQQRDDPSERAAQRETHRTSYDILADYYDLAFADRSDYIDFYGARIEPRTHSLLELGCGTGSVTSALGALLRETAIAGDVLVVGIDNSMRMLQKAAERDRDSCWIQGDIRRPPLEHAFDLVVSCFNTFQHLLTDDDLLATLRAARALMSGSGRFIFDIYQPNLDYLTSVPKHRVADTLVHDDGLILEIQETNHYDSKARILTSDWTFIDTSSRKQLGRSCHRMRQYYHDDIARALASCRLEIREKFGDFDGAPWTPASKKQFFVCAPL